MTQKIYQQTFKNDFQRELMYLLNQLSGNRLPERMTLANENTVRLFRELPRKYERRLALAPLLQQVQKAITSLFAHPTFALFLDEILTPDSIKKLAIIGVDRMLAYMNINSSAPCTAQTLLMGLIKGDSAAWPLALTDLSLTVKEDYQTNYPHGLMADKIYQITFEEVLLIIKQQALNDFPTAFKESDVLHELFCLFSQELTTHLAESAHFLSYCTELPSLQQRLQQTQIRTLEQHTMIHALKQPNHAVFTTHHQDLLSTYPEPIVLQNQTMNTFHAQLHNFLVATTSFWIINTTHGTDKRLLAEALQLPSSQHVDELLAYIPVTLYLDRLYDSYCVRNGSGTKTSTLMHYLAYYYHGTEDIITFDRQRYPLVFLVALEGAESENIQFLQEIFSEIQQMGAKIVVFAEPAWTLPVNLAAIDDTRIEENDHVMYAQLMPPENAHHFALVEHYQHQSPEVMQLVGELIGIYFQGTPPSTLYIDREQRFFSQQCALLSVKPILLDSEKLAYRYTFSSPLWRDFCIATFLWDNRHNVYVHHQDPWNRYFFEETSPNVLVFLTEKLSTSPSFEDDAMLFHQRYIAHGYQKNWVNTYLNTENLLKQVELLRPLPESRYLDRESNEALLFPGIKFFGYFVRYTQPFDPRRIPLKTLCLYVDPDEDALVYVIKGDTDNELYINNFEQNDFESIKYRLMLGNRLVAKQVRQVMQTLEARGHAKPEYPAEMKALTIYGAKPAELRVRAIRDLRLIKELEGPQAILQEKVLSVQGHGAGISAASPNYLKPYNGVEEGNDTESLPMNACDRWIGKKLLKQAQQSLALARIQEFSQWVPSTWALYEPDMIDTMLDCSEKSHLSASLVAYLDSVSPFFNPPPTDRAECLRIMRQIKAEESVFFEKQYCLYTQQCQNDRLWMNNQDKIVSASDETIQKRCDAYTMKLKEKVGAVRQWIFDQVYSLAPLHQLPEALNGKKQEFEQAYKSYQAERDEFHQVTRELIINIDKRFEWLMKSFEATRIAYADIQQEDNKYQLLNAVAQGNFQPMITAFKTAFAEESLTATRKILMTEIQQKQTERFEIFLEENHLQPLWNAQTEEVKKAIKQLFLARKMPQLLDCLDENRTQNTAVRDKLLAQLQSCFETELQQGVVAYMGSDEIRQFMWDTFSEAMKHECFNDIMLALRSNEALLALGQRLPFLLEQPHDIYLEHYLHFGIAPDACLVPGGKTLLFYALEQLQLHEVPQETSNSDAYFENVKYLINIGATISVKCHQQELLEMIGIRCHQLLHDPVLKARWDSILESAQTIHNWFESNSEGEDGFYHCCIMALQEHMDAYKQKRENPQSYRQMFLNILAAAFRPEKVENARKEELEQLPHQIKQLRTELFDLRKNFRSIIEKAMNSETVLKRGSLPQGVLDCLESTMTKMDQHIIPRTQALQTIPEVDEDRDTLASMYFPSERSSHRPSHRAESENSHYRRSQRSTHGGASTDSTRRSSIQLREELKNVRDAQKVREEEFEKRIAAAVKAAEDKAAAERKEFEDKAAAERKEIEDRAIAAENVVETLEQHIAQLKSEPIETSFMDAAEEKKSQRVYTNGRNSSVFFEDVDAKNTIVRGQEDKAASKETDEEEKKMSIW